MSPQAMSPLRRRMIEDRTIRQFGDKTKSVWTCLGLMESGLAGGAPFELGGADEVQR
jgi:hypothetical protein